MAEQYVTNKDLLNIVEKGINNFFEIRHNLGCTKVASEDCAWVTSLLNIDQTTIGSKCKDNCPFEKGSKLERYNEGLKFTPSKNYKPLKSKKG